MATLTLPEVVPSPTHDSERIRVALHGWIVDQKVIIWILGHRNAIQRRKIRETYPQLYKESIVHCLQSGLSGALGTAMSCWMEEPPERDARFVEKTLKKRKVSMTQLQVIVEIACASSPNHLIAVRQAYCSLFDCSLEEAITSKVSPSLQKLLVGLVSSYRYDKELVDLNVAKSEAAKLHDAIEKKQLDHDEVMLIFSTRNFFQLRATFEHYLQNYQVPIYQAVMSTGNDDLGSLLRAVILCIDDSPVKHFAEVISSSLSGHRTDELSLGRVIVTRVEIDMMKIKEEYFNMNKISLDDVVGSKTSGGYKNFLMALIGARI